MAGAERTADCKMTRISVRLKTVLFGYKYLGMLRWLMLRLYLCDVKKP